MKKSHPPKKDFKKVLIASDHAGFDLKKFLINELEKLQFQVLDLGCDSSAKSVDYPDFAQKLCKKIAEKNQISGILICGSGIGISIAVNRNPAARCALVSDTLSARLAREHNDANVIAFGARLIGPDTAKDALSTFLATPFAGDRHAARVAKLTQPQPPKEPT